MNYKTLLLACMSLSSVYGLPKTTLVTLLDQVYEAQTYWSTVEGKSGNFWKRPPHKWFSNTWNREVKIHKKALSTLESELIKTLADESTPASLSHLSQQKQYYVELALHGVPSHFNRRWFSYAASLAGIATLIGYLYHFSQTHTLFILDPTAPPFIHILEGGHPFEGHDFVDKEGRQYLQVKKSQETVAQTFLNNHEIQYKQTDPSFSLSWYNEQGETKIKEFIYKHGVDPIKEILKILKNESQNQLPILTTDPVLGKKLLETRLTTLITNAQKETETAALIERHLRNRAVETLSFEEKRNILDSLFCELSEIAPTQLKNFMEIFSQLETTLQKNSPLPAFKKLPTDLLPSDPLLCPDALPTPDRIPTLGIPTTFSPLPTPGHTELPPLPTLETVAPYQKVAVPFQNVASIVAQPASWYTPEWIAHLNEVAHNGEQLTQEAKNLLNNFTQTSQTFYDTAYASKQIQDCTNTLLNTVAATQNGLNALNAKQAFEYPKQHEKSLMILETARSINEGIEHGHQFLNAVEEKLIPPVTNSILEVGKLAATLDNTVQHINTETLPELNLLLKTTTQTLEQANNSMLPKVTTLLDATTNTIEHANKTTLVKVDALLDTANQATPELIKSVNQTLRDAHAAGTKVNHLLDHGNDLLPAITEIVDNSRIISNAVVYTLDQAKKMTLKHSDLWPLCAEIVVLRIMQRDLQAAASIHELGKTTERLKLNMELMATIPLMLATFALYKTSTSLYKRLTITPVLHTLRRDLICLQLLCNKERYSKNLSIPYKGLLTYWVARLKRYTQHLPKSIQLSYSNYLELLENKEMSPKQKITLIESMFREYDFLSHVQ